MPTISHNHDPADWVEITLMARLGLHEDEVWFKVGCGRGVSLPNWKQLPEVIHAFQRSRLYIATPQLHRPAQVPALSSIEAVAEKAKEKERPEIQWKLTAKLRPFVAWIKSVKEGPLKGVEELADVELQSLFFHGMVALRFDQERVMELLGITMPMIWKWRSDLTFAKVFVELENGKKDFIEAKLMKLVEDGDRNAIIFCARTLLADRGYSETLNLNHKGAVSLDLVKVADLGLPLDVLIAIESACEAKEREKGDETLALTKGETILLEDEGQAEKVTEEVVAPSHSILTPPLSKN